MNNALAVEVCCIDAKEIDDINYKLLKKIDLLNV